VIAGCTIGLIVVIVVGAIVVEALPKEEDPLLLYIHQPP
jgi:hypothetical protein